LRSAENLEPEQNKRRRSRELAAAAFGVPIDRVPPDAAIGSLEAWDSLAHLRLLLAVEKTLARELTPEEAASVLSLSDVERLLP
jgi:acyl carrier protein